MNLISHATQERLRGLLEKLTTIAQHRMTTYKVKEILTEVQALFPLCRVQGSFQVCINILHTFLEKRVKTYFMLLENQSLIPNLLYLDTLT